MDLRLKPLHWHATPLSAVYAAAFDLSDMSQVDIHELARVLRTADAVLAYTARDASQFIALTGDVDVFTPATRVVGVHCTSTCQRLAISAMTVLVDHDSLGLAEALRCGELLEQAARCPCVVADGKPVACLAKAPWTA